MIKGQTLNDPPLLTQNAIFDWLEFTIFYDYEGLLTVSIIEYELDKIVRNLFNISLDKFDSEDRGRNGYNHLHNFKNINIWTSLNINMGIHIEITGQGCRDLEDLGISLKQLLNNINNSYRVKYSRIDLSIDDFTNKYFNVGKIRYYLENNLISSKLRTCYTTYSSKVEKNKIQGQTIQFGHKASLLHITFYNKLLERHNNNIILPDNIKYWTRTELRFRNEFAKDIVNLILQGKELNLIIKGILKDKIRFLANNKLATRKANSQTAKWWSDFLENCNIIKLNNPKVYAELNKSEKWLNDSVSKTQFMVFVSKISDITKIDPLTSDYLYEFLKLGSDKIKLKDLRNINDARIKNCLLPLTEQDLKDIICLLKDNLQEQKTTK